ncbi:MAG: CoA-binding protein [Dehalococcoidia bacterium]|nr:CoA-binding protein [Dehalococcoidia bacterium]
MTELYDSIDRIFHPTSVAFVGVTTSNPTHWTRTFWDSALAFHFKGNMYPVNPRGGELNGHKVYRSISEIPGEIDYAACTVSAKISPQIVHECAAKGAQAVHFCTAGFAEIGESGSVDLQQQLVDAGKETGVRIIGPNCMGIYCPEARFSYDIDFSRESGDVGFISQSGGNSIYVIREATWRGVKFSKVVSFGNACDLDESDFLEYMTEDPKTKIIALYLEGVRNGKRFRKLLERAARIKPVVMVKAGCGEAGSRATSTHTGSMAGNDAVWNSLCRQLNIIKHRNVEGLVDVLTTLQYLPGFKGRNVLLIGPGGGASIGLTDEFERMGFHLPAVTEKIRQQLLGFSQAAGNMLQNPIDYSQSLHNPGSMYKAVQLLTRWKEVDFCVGFFRPSQMNPSFFDMVCRSDGLVDKAFADSHKPVAYIIESGVTPDRQAIAFEMIQNTAARGRPVYYSFAGASEALRLVADYNNRKEKRL